MTNNPLKSAIRSIVNRFGIDFVKTDSSGFPLDFSELGKRVCREVRDFTMTSLVKINALVESVQYVEKNNISGAFVECGVWKGGSAMAMIYALQSTGAEDREFFLYDTFSGMTAPAEVDISFSGEKAIHEFTQTRTSEDSSLWCLSPLAEVKQNLLKTGYPEKLMHFVEGKVEETIPKYLPGKIAILRVDTDWYESTKHELVHLFPLLEPNGVLIIDDYGHWKGSQKAVDEYIAENNIRIFLNRLDYAGRIAIKVPTNGSTQNDQK